MRKLAALLAAVALGACSHSGGRPTANAELARVKKFVAPRAAPTTRPTPTTPTTLPPASQEQDALALAKRLGCATTSIGSKQKISGFPTPTQEVSCTIGGAELNVEVFASHADLAKSLTPLSRGVICALDSVFGVTGSTYLVVGDNFSVAAQSSASLDSGPTSGTPAQAKALGVALDLPVTTIDC